MAIRIYGNREIKTLPGKATRPTSSKVREALFNIWQGRVLDCRWLDLCAGSGAMGAEALCRGAAEVVGIEKSRAACQVIAQNWGKVAKSEQRYQVIKGDVISHVKTICLSAQDGKKDSKTSAHQPFDLIYFDPPYAAGLYDRVLNQVLPCLSPTGEIAVECGEGHWQPEMLSEEVATRLEIVREKRYGSTRLVFFQHISR